MDFLVKLHGGKGQQGGGSSGSRDTAMYHGAGEVPDDIPDIGSMIPVQRVD